MHGNSFPRLAMLVLLSTSVTSLSCVEPKRANGEPCLSNDQCETDLCQAGVCSAHPDLGTNYDAGTPPPVDASDEEAEAQDAAEGGGEEDAEPDAGEEAGLDAADDGGDDAESDAAADGSDDAPTDDGGAD